MGKFLAVSTMLLILVATGHAEVPIPTPNDDALNRWCGEGMMSEPIIRQCLIAAQSQYMQTQRVWPRANDETRKRCIAYANKDVSRQRPSTPSRYYTILRICLTGKESQFK